MADEVAPGSAGQRARVSRRSKSAVQHSACTQNLTLRVSTLLRKQIPGTPPHENPEQPRRGAVQHSVGMADR